MGKPVWGNYDAEALDAQYNARAAVPNHADFFADWAARSERYRAAAEARLDIAYGATEAERLDLFVPGSEGAPIHLFIHGGYWRSLDKSDFSFLAEPLVAAGALVAVVNYALCPAVTLDEIVRQMRAACAWAWRHAREYGGDPERIHLSGHSAGGHLTAMMLATDWPVFADDLPANLIKSGVPISGLFELAPLVHTAVNDDIRMDAETARRNSPALLDPASDAPLTVFVGGAESDEFRRQSREFVEAWRNRGAKVDYVELADLNHFTIVDRMSEPDDPVTRAILGHMGLA